MNKDFILPDFGEGIVQCEVIEWKVSEGEFVEEDQVIVEVSTDKAIVEIPCIYRGQITKLYYMVGDTADVHAPLYAIDIEEEAIESAKKVIENEEKDKDLKLANSSVPAPKDDTNQKFLTTPAVRNL